MRSLAALALALTASAAGAQALDRAALRHDSRDPLYRSPLAAVPVGTAVTLRLRSAAAGVDAVAVVTWDEEAKRGATHALERTRVSRDGAAALWEVSLASPAEPAVLRYRFVVRGGGETAYYEDDAPAAGQLPDAGTGAAYARSPDRGWPVTWYAPGFITPDWAKGRVLYQIFPDRFRNGDPSNDPAASWPTVHGEPVLPRAWGVRPEGGCRHDTGACCREDGHSRDFYGGDLEGIRQKLDALADLGVGALYLNPIFESPTNHKYDTRDYTRIDRAFGTEADFARLAKEAGERGIRLVLDGVFNHTSSDSVYFDRYSRYPSLGAYESRESPYASWYTFDPWPDGYRKWFGVPSLPMLTEDPEVRDFLFGPSGIAQRWLHAGAAGWRLDAMEQKSHAFWRALRAAVKRDHPDALVAGEFWHDAAPWLTGLEVDSVMNYRFRAAAIGFVNGETIDADGRIGDRPPSRFDALLRSTFDEYPPQARDVLMNLVDSHDTRRILWTLTPGANRPEEKESAANRAIGLRKLRLLATLQMTLPGAPTLYYGDEVGLTGDTDPDDRRTYPWGSEDEALRGHYRRLIRLRRDSAALRTGTFTTLLADDAAGTYAFLRHDADAVLVVASRSDAPRTAIVPVDGWLREGARLADAMGGAGLVVRGGAVTVALPALGSAVLTAGPSAIGSGPPPRDPLAAWTQGGPAPEPLRIPRTTCALPPPTGLRVSGASQAAIALAWDPVPGATAYVVARRAESETDAHPLARITGTRFADTMVARGARGAYTVRALDAHGNPSPASEAVEAAAEPARVRVTLVVRVPDPGTARVHVAGSFQGWVAGATPMTPDGAGRWTVTIDAREGDSLDYKYTLGTWETVEKGPQLEELPFRSVVAAPGADGTQPVTDAVARWRDTDPCSAAATRP